MIKEVSNNLNKRLAVTCQFFVCCLCNTKSYSNSRFLKLDLDRAICQEFDIICRSMHSPHTLHLHTQPAHSTLTLLLLAVDNMSLDKQRFEETEMTYGVKIEVSLHGVKINEVYHRICRTAIIINGEIYQRSCKTMIIINGEVIEQWIIVNREVTKER